MTERVYKIWCNIYFSPEQMAEREMLLTGVGKHEIRLFEPVDNGRDGESNQVLQESNIVFGQPYADTLMTCENLCWVHINSAGFTAYDREDLKQYLKRRDAIMTNSSAVFTEPCAQHLLAMILSFARGLPFALGAQYGDRSWQMHVLRPKIHLLNQQTALILGFGTIAQRLCELLAPLEMNLIGVKRTVHGSEPVRVIEQSGVDEYLPRADHLINILPANDETINFLNAARLATLKRGAIIYNIGRGTTIDQDALLAELKNGHLGGAYLDVTDTEPLPPEHPLWQAPNCFITPHVAGGHALEKEWQIKHFLENLHRFEHREDLINRIL